MTYQNPGLIATLRKDFNVEVIQPWHLRINGKIDIYPKTKKYFSIKEQLWGYYKGSPRQLRKHITYMLSDRRAQGLVNKAKRKEEQKGAPKLKGFQAWLATNPGPNEVYCVQLKTPPHIAARIRRTLKKRKTR